MEILYNQRVGGSNPVIEFRKFDPPAFSTPYIK